jgi:class 3 adenylate cyclase
MVWQGLVWLSCTLLVLRFVLAIFSPNTPETQWVFSMLEEVIPVIQGITNLLMMPLFMLWSLIKPMFPTWSEAFFPNTPAAWLIGSANQTLTLIPGLLGSPLQSLLITTDFEARYPGQLEWLALGSIPFWLTLNHLIEGLIGLLKNIIHGWFSVAEGATPDKVGKSFLTKDNNQRQQSSLLAKSAWPADKTSHSSSGYGKQSLGTTNNNDTDYDPQQFALHHGQQSKHNENKTSLANGSATGGDLRLKQLLQNLKEENRQLQLKQHDLRNTFSSFFSPAVLNYLEKNPDALDLPSTHTQVATVLFCDIRGFTHYSQHHSPEQISAYLSQFFDIVNRVILQQYDGTINKLIGDSVLAYWNFPMPCEAHALLATKAGLGILNTLKQYNQQPNVDPLHVGLGISTGLVSVGNVGSKEFKDFTIIGSPVNIASRLQEANKELDTKILIDATTYQQLNRTVYCEAIGDITLRGVDTPQSVYQPLG